MDMDLSFVNLQSPPRGVAWQEKALKYLDMLARDVGRGPAGSFH